jgi:hypothetical protein
MSPSDKHSERMQTARVGKSGYMTQKEQRRENLKTIMQHGRKIKKHQEWMSKELGNTIENFNEMFINNLSLSLTQIFVDKDHKIKEQQQESENSDEEDEEEEEEGDHVFDIEVVGQAQHDLEKSQKVDQHLHIALSHNRKYTEEGEEDKEDMDDGQTPASDLYPEHIDELIEQSDEANAKNKEMQEHIKEQEKTVIKIEGSLRERERLLEAVKESHSLMQNSLIEEMKKEYNKKVKEMEYEIDKLKADHKLSIRGATSQGDKNNIEEQYKKKMVDLEDKLATYKTKEKQQKKMEKEVVKQSNKIRVLEMDIEKIRNQKANLNKKLKEYDEKYKKWKTDKSNEIVMMKKSGLKKDREINKLKRESRKNEIFAQRKVAELNLMKRRQQQEEVTRKKEEVRRKKVIKNKSKSGKGFKKGQNNADANDQSPEKSKADESQQIDIEKIREWIEANVEKMVTVKHLQKDLDDFESKKQQVENEINEEQKYYSEISIKKEKAIMRKSKLKIGQDEGEALEIDKDIEEYDSILKQNQESIESLEDKIGYHNQQIINLEQTIEDVNNSEIKGLNLSQIHSVQSAQTLLIAFFNVILEVKIQKVELEETVIEQHSSILELEKELKILRESKRTTELEFNRALQKQEQDFRELGSQLMQEAESKMEMVASDGLTVLEAKRMEKKRNEQQYSTGAYEDSKRKLSKMMSQLERKLNLEEKKNLVMANVIEQSKAEKEQYKQRYNNLKNQIKQVE